MEDVYKINPTSTQFNSPKSGKDSGKFNYIAIFSIVVFLVFVSYFIYTGFFQKQNQEQIENKKIYTEEEKLQILSLISESSSNDIPIEEKREILKQVSEKSSVSQEKQLSKEEKLNILYSLQ